MIKTLLPKKIIPVVLGSRAEKYNDMVVYHLSPIVSNPVPLFHVPREMYETYFACRKRFQMAFMNLAFLSLL